MGDRLLIKKRNIYRSVMLGFDDGTPDFYSTAYPLLTEYGVKATNYTTSNSINTDGMTTAQLQEMSQTGNVDIGNHGAAHADFTTKTKEEIKTSLTTCKNALDAIGLTRASSHHAFPFGKYNATALEAVAELGFPTARTTAIGQMDIEYIHDNSMLHTLPIYKGVTPDIEVSTIKSWVDSAISEGTTHYMLFHIISDGDSPLAYPIAKFEEVLAYIQSVGIVTETISGWYARYSAKYV